MLLDLERDGATRIRPYAGWAVEGASATFSFAVAGGRPEPALELFARSMVLNAAWPPACALAATRAGERVVN